MFVPLTSTSRDLIFQPLDPLKNLNYSPLPLTEMLLQVITLRCLLDALKLSTPKPQGSSLGLPF